MFNLKIHNFRSFQKASFEFSRINILIGENSSGKSSLLKFLLAVKQSFGNSEISNLKLDGPLVDLGNYKEIIYKHAQNRSIQFSFSFLNGYENFVKEWLAPEQYNKEGTPTNKEEWDIIFKNLEEAFKVSTDVHFEIDKNLGQHSSIITRIENKIIGSVIIEHIKSEEKEETKIGGEYPKCNLRITFANGQEYFIEKVMYEKDGFLTKIFGKRLWEYCQQELKDLEVFYKTAYLLLSQNYLITITASANYCNPMFSEPERLFIERDKTGRYKNINLKMVVNILSDPSLKKEARELLLSELNQIIKYFGLAEEITFNKVEGVPVSEIRASIDGISNNIMDVGYGVALQIPILFQAFFSNLQSDKSLFMIEQPEIHLHPSLQAKLIETLIKFGPNNIYFIETHSEYIVRKLQSLVKQKAFDLGPSDVTIHYMKKGKGKSEITLHKISKDGHLIPNLPSGFTDSSYSLAKELL